MCTAAIESGQVSFPTLFAIFQKLGSGLWKNSSGHLTEGEEKLFGNLMPGKKLAGNSTQGLEKLFRKLSRTLTQGQKKTLRKLDARITIWGLNPTPGICFRKLSGNLTHGLEQRSGNLIQGLEKLWTFSRNLMQRCGNTSGFLRLSEILDGAQNAQYVGTASASNEKHTSPTGTKNKLERLRIVRCNEGMGGRGRGRRGWSGGVVVE